jgi:dTDP-4-dehydrorhamnose 3,5-epimerase
MHRDERGMLMEILRETWDTGVAPVQWNVVSSRAGVFRGVHVHVNHEDYLVLLQGRASFGLRDLRRGSPTEGAVALVEMSGDRPAALTIPRGVAHGFYYHEPSLHAYGLTACWDPSLEFVCHWADPALEIPWPAQPRILSDRDAAAPPLNELMARLAPYQPIG